MESAEVQDHPVHQVPLERQVTPVRSVCPVTEVLQDLRERPESSDPLVPLAAVALGERAASLACLEAVDRPVQQAPLDGPAALAAPEDRESQDGPATQVLLGAQALVDDLVLLDVLVTPDQWEPLAAQAAEAAPAPPAGLDDQVEMEPAVPPDLPARREPQEAPEGTDSRDDQEPPELTVLQSWHCEVISICSTRS